MLTTHKEKPYPINFGSLAFFSFTTGVFFGTTSPTWPNNVNWYRGEESAGKKDGRKQGRTRRI